MQRFHEGDDLHVTHALDSGVGWGGKVLLDDAHTLSEEVSVGCDAFLAADEHVVLAVLFLLMRGARGGPSGGCGLRAFVVVC